MLTESPELMKLKLELDAKSKPIDRSDVIAKLSVSKNILFLTAIFLNLTFDNFQTALVYSM